MGNHFILWVVGSFGFYFSKLRAKIPRQQLDRADSILRVTREKSRGRVLHELVQWTGNRDGHGHSMSQVAGLHSLADRCHHLYGLGQIRIIDQMSGRTALHYAAAFGAVQCLRLILADLIPSKQQDSKAGSLLTIRSGISTSPRTRLPQS